jgi:hypothetical protein
MSIKPVLCVIRLQQATTTDYTHQLSIYQTQTVHAVTRNYLYTYIPSNMRLHVV